LDDLYNATFERAPIGNLLADGCRGEKGRWCRCSDAVGVEAATTRWSSLRSTTVLGVEGGTA
jgi:hypothetical protein